MESYCKPEKYQINIGGEVLELSPHVIERYPDSVFEAIFSGRQQMNEINGIPFLDRDPKKFKNML